MSFSIPDGSEDVQDFLQRIKEIGIGMDQEDEECNKKLEADIIQSKKERQARREERARSISPTKSSPTETPTKNRLPVPQMLTSPDSYQIVSSGDGVNEYNLVADGGLTSSQKKTLSSCNYKNKLVYSDMRESSDQSSQPNNPSITPPILSWQKRPSFSDQSYSTNQKTPRPNILAPGKIYSHDNVSPDSISNDRFQKDLATDEPNNSSSALSSVNYHGDNMKNKCNNVIASVGSDSSPSAPVNSPQTPILAFSSKPEHRDSAVYITQLRLSPDKPDRPSSPTKGSGGFVQSAMMRRNDSVNKRWSAHKTMNINMNRSEPVSSSVLSTPTGKPSSPDVENSSHSRSKSTSSYSRITAVPERPLSSNSFRGNILQSRESFHENSEFSIPRTITATGARNGSMSMTELTDPQKTSPEISSKTQDRRRWSPIKSSWLEAALNKPESFKPKTKTIPSPQQPAWMAEINKAKQRSSIDVAHAHLAGPKHEVNIGGMMRSPSGVPLPVSPQSGGSLPNSNLSASSPGPSGLGIRLNQNHPRCIQNPDLSNSSIHLNSTKPPASSFSTPFCNQDDKKIPLKDLRANLKPRRPTPDNAKSTELDLKTLMCQLRPTKTQNYVASDELKDNITRGRAALNITGGPRKSVIKDELKEAILQKKQDFKKAQIDVKGVSKTPSINQTSALPEALVRQRTLKRSESVSETAKTDLDLASHQHLMNLPWTKKPSNHKSCPKTETGRISNRVNQTLDKILTRESMSECSGDNLPSSSAIMTQSDVSATASAQIGHQLTHMTRDRARGPPRRAPTKLFVSSGSSGSPAEIKQNSLGDQIFTKIISLPTGTDNLTSNTPRTIVQADDTEVSTFQPLLSQIDNVAKLVCKADKFEMSMHSTPKISPVTKTVT